VTDEFLRRVFAVALTDSVHSLEFVDNVSDQVKQFFVEVSLHLLKQSSQFTASAYVSLQL